MANPSVFFEISIGGNVEGIVTMDDVLEDLFGEIEE